MGSTKTSKKVTKKKVTKKKAVKQYANRDEARAAFLDRLAEARAIRTRGPPLNRKFEK